MGRWSIVGFVCVVGTTPVPLRPTPPLLVLLSLLLVQLLLVVALQVVLEVMLCVVL